MDDYVADRYRRCATLQFYTAAAVVFLFGFVCGFLAHWIVSFP